MKSIRDWLNEQQKEPVVSEVSPPGWSGSVAAMLQKHPDIDNPWALAWSMKKKGAKSHYKEQPKKDSQSSKKPEKKEKYKDEDEGEKDKKESKPKKKVKKFGEWAMEREHPESLMLHEDMSQTLGISPEEIAGMPFFDLVVLMRNRGLPQPLQRASLAKFQATRARRGATGGRRG